MKTSINLVIALFLALTGVNAIGQTTIIIAQPLGNQVAKILASADVPSFKGVDTKTIEVKNLSCNYREGLQATAECSVIDTNGVTHMLSGIGAQLLIDDLTSSGVQPKIVADFAFTTVVIEVPEMICNANIVNRFKFICSIPTI
jgi:hypothetical protein